MIVLQKGSSSKWRIERYCTGYGNGDEGCWARLLIEGEDIILTRDVDNPDNTKKTYSFKCPECGKLTDVRSIDIPLAIRRRLGED